MSGERGHKEVFRNRTWRSQLHRWARNIKRDVVALYLSARDPRVPWYAKAVAFVVAGYALSPIDLIPDFVPILGYLDDLILVPLGILLAMKLIPPALLEEHRATAARTLERPKSRAAMIAIVTIWVGLGLVGLILFLRPARQQGSSPY